MKTKIIKIILFIGCASFLFTSPILSLEPPTVSVDKRMPKEKSPAPVPGEAKKPMSKSEILEDIKNDLENEGEIFDYIPGLKKEKDSAGKEFYSYQGTALENLTQEKLEGLAVRINQTATKIHTDRIQQQLETIRQTQNMPRIPPSTQISRPQIPSQPKRPQTPPPQTNIPPQPPRR